MHQLMGRCPVRGHHAAQSADLANVADQGASVDIPNDRDFVAIQVKLRTLGGSPTRGDLREFTDDQRFDERPCCLFVIEIRANISNVRIGETNNLPCVTWVGENFLISGEAGIENDFAAAAREGAGSAAIKDAPVFERERGRSVLNFGQWCVLRRESFRLCFRRRRDR
jgi:hypothetical protein